MRPVTRPVAIAKVGRQFYSLNDYYDLIDKYGVACDIEWEYDSDCGVAYFIEFVGV